MSTYARLRDLPLVVEGYERETLSRDVSAGWVRKTTLVRLRGGAQVGVGEDVTYQAEAHEAFWSAPLELRGETTLEGFSHRLDACELFPAEVGDSKAPLFRRWALESAALDLALRQAGTSLAAKLGRRAQPLRFAVSLGLGSPPEFSRLERLWERAPGVELKLDADPSWDDALLARLAASGKVAVVDFKGQYKGEFRGPAPDAELYRRVAEALPEAWLEDPGWTPATREALAPHMERVTYDAPMCSLSDLVQRWPRPRALNVKPSRYGSLQELCRVYDYCAAQGIAVYGGGQFELGEGRRQAQLLASLFHPSGPNDLAPSAFNEAELPADLPGSPLPIEDRAGF